MNNVIKCAMCNVQCAKNEQVSMGYEATLPLCPSHIYGSLRYGALLIALRGTCDDK